MDFFVFWLFFSSSHRTIRVWISAFYYHKNNGQVCYFCHAILLFLKIYTKFTYRIRTMLFLYTISIAYEREYESVCLRVSFLFHFACRMAQCFAYNTNVHPTTANKPYNAADNIYLYIDCIKCLSLSPI